MATTTTTRLKINRRERKSKLRVCLDEFFPLFICSFAVIAFGGFEGWAQALIGIFSVTALFLSFPLHLPEESAPEKNLFFRPFAFYCIFLSLIVFSILPLPSFLVRLFSPETSRIWSLSGRPAFWVTLSLNRYATLKRFSLLFSAGAVFFLFRQMPEQTRNKTLSFLSVLGIALAVVGIFGTIYPGKKIYWVRPVVVGHPLGPFINRNHFAGYLNLTFFLSTGLLIKNWSEKRSLSPVLAAVGLPVMLAAIFLSLSRSGAVGFIAGLFTLLTALIIRDKTWRNLFWLIPALAIGILLIRYLGAQKVVQRLSTLQDPMSSITVQMRLSVWKDTLDIFKRYPLFGTGIGTAPAVLPVYKTSFIHRYFANTENEYLELLAETGILGFLAVILFLTSTVVQETQNLRRGLFPASIIFRKRSPGSGPAGGPAIGAAAAIAAGMAQALFDFNLHVPAITLTFALALGLLHQPDHREIPSLNKNEDSGATTRPLPLQILRQSLRNAKGRGGLVVLLAALFLLLFNLRQLACEYSLFKSNRPAGQDTMLSAAYLKRAVRFAGSNPEPFYRLGRSEYENGWKMALVEKKKVDEFLSLSYADLDEAGRRSPADWRFPYYQTLAAESLARLGHPEWRGTRDRKVEETITLNPTEYLIFLSFSELYLNEDPSKSAAFRRKATLICPWAK